MTDLQVLLDTPIAWKDWTTNSDLLSLLVDLQANILKGHGRDHTQNIFLSFTAMDSRRIAALLRDLSFVTTSALEQLRDAAAFSAAQISGGTVICVMLSMGGYRKLGIPSANVPGDLAFREGMITRGRLDPMNFTTFPGFDAPSLNDPARDRWETGGAWDPSKAAPDAMILVADDSASGVGNAVSALQKIFAENGAIVLGRDTGFAQRRAQPSGSPKGEGIEHFGYVDGVSQPLFLAEDLPSPAGKWDEVFKPSQFIVPDPGNPTSFSCGSYFVYRKLEQNVKKFKQQEEALAAALGLIGVDEERAGALVVGRFEDGTPVVMSGKPTVGVPTNNFDYSGQGGLKCPFRAHIRKTNPRSPGDVSERSRIMARRGITYGTRKPDFSDEPEDKVGLLFMAYMADINEQFEFTQSAWANNPNFPDANVGIDVVIGQPQNVAAPDHNGWQDEWSKPVKSASFDFQQAVTLMGGEYFFAPSISFLQSAGQFVSPAMVA